MVFFVSILFLAYLLLTGAWFGRFFPGETKVAAKQKVCFGFGLLLFLLCWASPLYLFSHVMFSMHMLQMAILYFFAAPLLILGIPAGMLQPIRKFTASCEPAWRFLTRPATALLVFNGLFLLYHIPIVMSAMMANTVLHTGFYGLLFAAALWVWWPVVNPDRKNRLAGKERQTFARANAMVLMPACLLLLFSFVPYDVFAAVSTQMNMLGLCVPHTVSLTDLLQVRDFTPFHDQQLGALIMMVLHKMAFMLVGRTSSPSSGETIGSR